MGSRREFREIFEYVFQFLYTTHFLCDNLILLLLPSKMYQRKNMDFSEVTLLLTTNVSRLEEIQYKKNDRILASLLKAAPNEP